MNRKLSDSMTFELTWLRLKELQDLLLYLHVSFNKVDDRYEIINFIAKNYTDDKIKSYIDKCNSTDVK